METISGKTYTTKNEPYIVDSEVKTKNKKKDIDKYKQGLLSANRCLPDGQPY